MGETGNGAREPAKALERRDRKREGVVLCRNIKCRRKNIDRVEADSDQHYVTTS